MPTSKSENLGEFGRSGGREKGKEGTTVIVTILGVLIIALGGFYVVTILEEG